MNIELKEGEVLCDRCLGEPFLCKLDSVGICSKCWGTGKLDWIESCTGKQTPYEIVQMPILRTMYPKLISKELVSIQPINEKIDDNK